MKPTGRTDTSAETCKILKSLVVQVARGGTFQGRHKKFLGPKSSTVSEKGGLIIWTRDKVPKR
jgi:hypothetical protein